MDARRSVHIAVSENGQKCVSIGCCGNRWLRPWPEPPGCIGPFKVVG